MEHAFTLAIIAALYLAAKASPGPIFFVLSRYSMAGLRRSATLIAIGITTGSTVWAVMSLMGLSMVLMQTGWLYAALKIAGGAYLLYLGATMLLSSSQPAADTPVSTVDTMSAAKALRIGLLTSLTNPKSGVFWTSVFLVAFPPDAPAWMYPTTVCMITAMSFAWHMMLVTVFSWQRIRTVYVRIKRHIDRLTGTILILFGIRLLASDR
ncbi:MAG: LysE family transporter [Proteobacteria bacterium]|nr:LysE family transporter [Pseudomonadota bacterium]